jgi:transcription elongation factor GreA
MREDGVTYITKEGLQKIKEELEYLRNEKRAEISEKLEIAISHGDLSENADYAYAKQEQAFVEGFEDEAETYFIVGAHEADPSNGRISNESPIGRALLGAKLNQIVTVSAPAGEIQLKVTGIE